MQRVKRIYQAKRVLLIRHFRNIYPYVTLVKLFNIALSYVEFSLKREKLISNPAFIKIETSRLCHLRCSNCIHSVDTYKSSDDKSYSMTLTEVKKIIDPFHRSLFVAALTLDGEAFFNKEIFSIIKYIHQKRIGTSFPTNFSIKLNNEKMEKLVLSGLDTILIALDGATEESYSQYRKGGNFNLVLQNVKSLAETKIRLKNKNPRIVWKFIVFPHNKHEIEYVKNNYKRLGFDSYSLVYDTGYDDDLYQTQRDSYKQNRINKKKACFWIWFTTVVNWEGIVHPCTRADHDLGNAFNESFKSIWNNEHYRRLRRGFRKNNFGENMDKICYECNEIKA